VIINYIIRLRKVAQTGNAANTVTTSINGNEYKFTMPSFDVTVTAVFSLYGMSSKGIAVSNDITITGFLAATAGNSVNTRGTDGSFNFTVSLSAGSASATGSNSGAISATTYTPPVTYTVSISKPTNGNVTVSPAGSAEAGTVVILTVIPAAGYELDSLAVDGRNVTASISADRYFFVMPSHGVTVLAAFRKTQATLDAEAVAAAKAKIENGTYRIAQATGNTEAAVRNWLVNNTLNVLFNQSSEIQFRSTAGSVTDALVTMKSFTPAIAGTEASPAGKNGSFRYTATLTRGATTLETVEISGIIFATPTASTPVKAVELVQLDETVRILNTGNIATGDLVLTLTGSNAAVFTLLTTVPGESLTLYNIQGQLVYNGKAIANEQTIYLSVRGMYVVVSGNRRVKAIF
jgi:hypothetical protein